MRSINYKSKNPDCQEPMSSDTIDILTEFSQEQKDVFYSLRELSCNYGNKYGLGENFTIQTEGRDPEIITINTTIGQGGSKKATLLSDGRVIMLPNLAVTAFISASYWWATTVTNEAEMATFLESIEIHALDRKKAYLSIPSKDNPEISYKLPVLLSSSFEQYTTKNYFIQDCKNYESSKYSKEEWDFWQDDLATWEKPIKPLIKDIWKLKKNNIQIGTDSSNSVLIKNENGDFEIRYFGYDFGGKYGSIKPPSKEILAITNNLSNDIICKMVSIDAKGMIEEFIYNRLRQQLKERPGKYQDLVFDEDGKPEYIVSDEKFEFIKQARDYFSSCEFINKVVLGLDNNAPVDDL